MDGLLLFNKPILWTSHDAVDFIRRRAGQKTVGHAGTLDPLATGLLLILLGKWTKRQDELMGLDKSYEGTILFGVETDSYDMDGKLQPLSGPVNFGAEKVSEVFAGFTGKISQVPPVYSALKVEGRKMYEIARSGEVFTPKSREVEVSEFALNYFHEDEAAFSLSCSKGTYVRSLAFDAGKKLGCGGVLSSLVRTRIGSFYLRDAVSAQEIMQGSPQQMQERLYVENLSRV